MAQVEPAIRYLKRRGEREVSKIERKATAIQIIESKSMHVFSSICAFASRYAASLVSPSDFPGIFEAIGFSEGKQCNERNPWHLPHDPFPSP